ncbi:unnamed protein product [Cylindrotheca closterium]|uniref:DUF6824 domain-containing protein n=1 Tax=Cylindrotheca closterium TaxID=2856 RepID=A0AAD2JGQ2_9STRA|nr:unnamed protein product [Cylindrotheca closterium]
MLPRIRERIANEVRQGGGNPFDQMNFGADNNNNNNNRNNAAAGQNDQAAEAAAAANQQAKPQFVRPSDLYLGCSTRVRRELLRINEWDRLIALKDVWTKQVAEAPTQEELDEENGQEGGGGNANANAAANNNDNDNNDRMLPANVNLMEFLNGTGNDATNENTDHDIREIMEHNIKKHRFRPAYYKVQFLNPTYSANLDLLKLFHKRHAGNPKLAAQQFCRYWDLKLQYFGLEQLCKPLTLKALSSQDKACLHNGCMQLSRDDHGRTVLSLLPSLLTVEQANGPKPMDTGDKDAEESDEANKLVCPHLVRALWYLIFRALQDKGETNMVILVLGQDKADLFSKTILHCTSMLREALPFNVVALHYLDGPGMSTLDEDESSTNGQNVSHHHNHENFLWRQQPDNQEDMHGFGGLEQVAEWGGAVQVPDHQLPQENVPLHHEGNQDEQQQLRLLDKSKASLEHLEDRVGRNVRLRLRFHNLFELQLEELRNSNEASEVDDENDEKDPFGVLRKRLIQFGIPNIPLNSDGTLIMHNPIDSSSKRFFFTRPEYTLSNNLILPTPNDILLGKGRPYQEHPGNIAMNDIIDKFREEYTSCKTRTEKTAMSQSILETIRKQGGRFLIKKSKDDDLWVVATDAKARDKVAHSFRMPRKFLKDAIKEKRLKEQQEAQGDKDGAGGGTQQQQQQASSNDQQARN